jgi:hypothetical protein
MKWNGIEDWQSADVLDFTLLHQGYFLISIGLAVLGAMRLRKFSHGIKNAAASNVWDGGIFPHPA